MDGIRAVTDAARPVCHFRPAAGWMNDPNGPIYHGGWYHLFFQHDPSRDTWGRMHWGHARSRDLVRWELLPHALTPAVELGEDHCFSGCAWRDSSSRPLLFYTSVRGDHEGYVTEQWAVRASGALDEFRRVEENPVIGPGSEPGAPYGPTARDPFVFERAGRTFLVLGADLPGEGYAPMVPLFEATRADLLGWRHLGNLYRPPPDEVRFLECPNLLRVGESDVLVYSPHGAVEYLVGEFDVEAGVFCVFGDRSTGRIDENTDFYATNRFALEEGKAEEPALVGWVRGWSAGRGWNGALSVPRRLTLSADGELLQRPVAAFAGLRGTPAESGAMGPGAPATASPGFEARSFDLEASVRTGGGRGGLRLVDAASGTPVLELIMEHGDPDSGRVELGGCGFDLPDSVDGMHNLRLIWDRSMAELFVDAGRRACTKVVDTASGGPVRVEWFAAEGRFEVLRSTAWPLASIW